MIRIYVAILSGQAPQNENFVNENIAISSIDICGNYELICTKFSEIVLLNREY